MDDLLTGELQPVRRAPPPPRLPPPSSRQTHVNSFTSLTSFPEQLPPPLPRFNSGLQKSRNNDKNQLSAPSFTQSRPIKPSVLHHSPSMPLSSSNGTNGGVQTGKKVPPPRPPPPKINSRMQRLEGRKHANLTSGGQGVTLSGPPRSSRQSHHALTKSSGVSGAANGPVATTEAVLIDLSPPPRSPSLATSGSDGLSVNSFGSESSGNFCDAPSSWMGSGSTTTINGKSNISSRWNSDSINGKGGFINDFDPFASLEEESHDKNLTVLNQFTAGGSFFYDTSIQSHMSNGSSHKSSGSAATLSGLGCRYNSKVFQTHQNNTFVDWSADQSKKSNFSPSLADPFNPQPKCNGDEHRAQQQQNTTSSTTTASPTNNSNGAINTKARTGFRATIIRPKPTQSLDKSSYNGSASRLKTSVHHSASSPAPLATLGGYTSPPGGVYNSSTNTEFGSSEENTAVAEVTSDLAATALGDTQANHRERRQGATFAEAEFDYDSVEPGDLCLKVGDRVELVAAINSDWLEGRLGGRQGLFPRAFVKILDGLPVAPEPSAAPEPPTAPESFFAPEPLAAAPPPISTFLSIPDGGLASQQAVALYTFMAELPTDLTLMEGSVVTVMAVVEGGQWLLGHCEGRSGQFPANFVSRVPEHLPVVTL